MRYYLQIAYGDHDTTFLQLNTDGVTSATTGDEAAAAGEPVPFHDRYAGAAGQVWRAGAIRSLVSKPHGPLDLFPRVHVRSNGQVVVTGSLAETWSLGTSGAGTWTDLGIQRPNGLRDYAPSVLFGADQVLYIGGGSPPIADAALLDLSQQPLAWRDPQDPASRMTFPRRQHNATILPDGSVLVTGGTRSGGAGPPENFNNLDPGQPGTAQPGDIQKVTWIGLSSVTHSFNTGQRFIALAATPSAGGLNVTAPASPDICPPGHYLMFLVSTAGVPSVAKIVHVAATAAAPAAARTETAAPVRAAAEPEDVFALRASILAAATGTKVVVGITGTCPYGIAACWGGANEALFHLDGVEYVDPIANAEDSTATVFLAGGGLPPLDAGGKTSGGLPTTVTRCAGSR